MYEVEMKQNIANSSHAVCDQDEERFGHFTPMPNYDRQNLILSQSIRVSVYYQMTADVDPLPSLRITQHDYCRSPIPQML